MTDILDKQEGSNIKCVFQETIVEERGHLAL